ncbi:MAG: Fe(3+)-hydroxamate ABC transporter permease FhuB [Rhodobacteraceae bacterium]|nr:Fe(3+)-hydroxamate ABC transporter permease FhuB [Paracoccaceae bacterium]MAY47233.1 Fe(3+)-hydroxamate ABC transporter permease FhuB [Paracoccaceae bacterium]
MTRRMGICLALALLVAVALWHHAATVLTTAWPLPPFDPDALTLNQILLAFGLMPRGLMALLAGALLGLSGALLQTVFRNPVADPSTLGISSGAQLALVMATVLAPNLLAWGSGPVALAGAGAAALLVMGLGATRAFHPVTMVIGGMLVGLFASAVATAITLSQGQYLFSLVIWNGGSLVQTSWTPAAILAVVLAAGAIATTLIARPLRVLSIGAEGAASLGMNVAVIRALTVMLAVILAASVSATVGLVAFVGLAAPAAVRALGARHSSQILTWSPVAGALILSLADGLVLSLNGLFGEMFPTGAITGLIGGPLLLALLPRLRNAAPPATEALILRRTHPVRLLTTLGVLIAVGTVALAMIGRLPDGWWLLDLDTARDFLPNRLPRLIGAASAGGLLALAGALLQRLTANPLASPEVLGVSGGAAIGYAAVIFTAAGPTTLDLTAGAGAGGAAALALVAYHVLRRDMGPERVLLAGIAVSALATAILSAIMAAGTMRSFAILAWLSGSASALTASGAIALLAILLILMAACLAMTRWLTILPLGGPIARSLGVPLGLARLGIILAAGIATGAATILVGPLSFVGLMAPHLARRLGLARVSHHLAGSVLIGAALMLASDFGARMASFPYDLPLGLFASLLGAPWLVWLMLRRAR